MPVVVMNTTVTGTRDGEYWPPAGGSIDLDDAEARHLIAAGLARPVVEAAVAATVETATVNTKPPARKVRTAALSKSGGSW